MGIRHILRVLARSGSLRFSLDLARARTLARSGVRGKPLAQFRWRGRDVFYRPATSDPLAIYQVLLRRGGKAEYYLPPALQPEVILDIGSNIGSSILFFREQFPAATIYGFEPHPGTYLEPVRLRRRHDGPGPADQVESRPEPGRHRPGHADADADAFPRRYAVVSAGRHQ